MAEDQNVEAVEAAAQEETTLPALAVVGHDEDGNPIYAPVEEATEEPSNGNETIELNAEETEVSVDGGEAEVSEASDQTA